MSLIRLIRYITKQLYQRSEIIFIRKFNDDFFFVRNNFLKREIVWNLNEEIIRVVLILER